MQKQEQSEQLFNQLEQFRSYLNSVYPLDEQSWLAFKDKLRFLEFKKGDYLTKYGAIEQYVYFIINGAVRVFAIIKGEEYATNFRFDQEYTSSVTSFISRKPSIYSIESLTDVRTLAMHYDDVQMLYDQYPAINTIGRKIIESLYIEKHYREVEFLSQSAEDRYRNLCEKYPHFIENIPGKHIASFLGITPETLSRIRSKY